jgi:hypothetical protein
MKRLSIGLSIVLIAAFLAVGLAFIPQSAVFAAAPAQTNVDTRLQNAYLAEQNWLLRQSNALDRSSNAATKLQNLINNASAKGKDVTALQTALNNFNAALPAIQADHQQAANILSTHNGFDASGAVTDATAARNTLLTARQSLSQAHLALTNAVLTMRNALLTWRSANHMQ